MTAQMANIRVPDFSNSELATMMQETKIPSVADRLTDILAVSGEDEEFLDDSNKFHLTHSNIQRMIDSAIPRYEERTFRQLSGGMFRNTMESLPKITVKEPKKRIISSIYVAGEDIVKQDINPGTRGSTISSRPVMFTESQRFLRDIVGCFMKMLTFTTFITKMAKKVLRKSFFERNNVLSHEHKCWKGNRRCDTTITIVGTIPRFVNLIQTRWEEEIRNEERSLSLFKNVIQELWFRQV